MIKLKAGFDFDGIINALMAGGERQGEGSFIEPLALGICIELELGCSRSPLPCAWRVSHEHGWWEVFPGMWVTPS